MTPIYQFLVGDVEHQPDERSTVAIKEDIDVLSNTAKRLKEFMVRRSSDHTWHNPMFA